MTTSLRGRGSLGRRLAWCFGITLSLALAGSGYGAYALNQVAEQMHGLVERSVATERMASDWYRYASISVRRTSAIAVSADPSLTDFFKKETEENTKASVELQDKIGKLMVTDEEKRLYAEIFEVRKGYIAHRDAVTALKVAGDAEGARKTLDETKRGELYKKAQELVRDDGGAIISLFADAVGATRSNIKGWKLHPQKLSQSFGDVTIDA